MSVADTDGSTVHVRQRIGKWLRKFGKFSLYLIVLLLGISFVSSLFEGGGQKEQEISGALGNIDALYAKISELESQVEELENESDSHRSDLDGLTSRVDELESSVNDLDNEISGAFGLKYKLGTLEKKIKSIELDILFLK